MQVSDEDPFDNGTRSLTHFSLKESSKTFDIFAEVKLS